MQGFYTKKRLPSCDSRVRKRINHLLKVANSGNKPGKFAELLNYAKSLSSFYIKEYQVKESDIFVDIDVVNRIKVTGRVYS